MKVLIINLDQDAERLAVQSRQMSVLGLEWERIPAVTPQTLRPPADDPIWQNWQRPLRSTEMALFASHLKAWLQVISENAPCLILEDDALLAAATPRFLKQVAGLEMPDHITLETRGRKKILGRSAYPYAPIRRIFQDRTGSAAYVMFPSGAAKMMRRAAHVTAPSDAAINDASELVSFQADPALAIQFDQCTAHDMTPPIPVAPSTIDRVAKPALTWFSKRQQAGFRWRRIKGQFLMGIRMLAYMPVARRRIVALSQKWPDLTIKK